VQFPILQEIRQRFLDLTSDSGRTLSDLKADGQKLTGTVPVDQGNQREISDGKVGGDSISKATNCNSLSSQKPSGRQM
jgi:hypothetical protein